MPYQTDGTLTTDKRTVDDATTWDTQTDWEAFQSKTDIEIVNGVVQLAEYTVPDSQNLYAQYVAGDINAADGDAVTTWPDSSGNGRDATGGSPTFQTGVLNGEPVVSFDGTDDVLDTGYVWDTANPRSLYIVASVASGDTGYQYGTIDTSGTTDRTQVGIQPGNSQYLHSYGDNFTKPGTPPAGTYLIYGQTAGSGTSLLFENNTQVDSLSYASGDNAINDYIGARNVDGSANSYSDCEIAEILVYQADHGSTTRQDVWNYLNGKYAVF